MAGRRARGQLALQQRRRIGAHTWRAQRPWRLPGGGHRQPGIDVTLPKAADQADHKAEQQLMTREWRTPVRRVGDRRDGDGGSQMQAVPGRVVRDAQGDARGGWRGW